MAGRKGEYLFKRVGSDNWCIRFVYPEELRGLFGRKREWSLGTSDRDEAEALSAPLIEEHRRRLEDVKRAKDSDARPRNVTIAMPSAADFARINEIVRWIYERQGTVGDVQVVELATLNVLFSDPDIAFEFKMRFG